MASAIIHICVAKKVNEILKQNEKMLFLGTIAPDISKQIGKTKDKSHFLDNENDLPNISIFLKKYQNQLSDPFMLGYYIHLLTDYYWNCEFIPQFINQNEVHLISGADIKLSDEDITKLIYQDYTNLNIKLIDYYNLDLSLFYEDVETPNINMEEIPIKQLQIIVDKMGIIIKNSLEKNEVLFNMNYVIDFITNCTEKILKIV